MTELDISSVIAYARTQGFDVERADIAALPAHYIHLPGTTYRAMVYPTGLDEATATQLAMNQIYELISTHPEAKDRRCFVRARRETDRTGGTTLMVHVYVRSFRRPDDGFLMLY